MSDIASQAILALIIIGAILIMASFALAAAAKRNTETNDDDEQMDAIGIYDWRQTAAQIDLAGISEDQRQAL